MNGCTVGGQGEFEEGRGIRHPIGQIRPSLVVAYSNCRLSSLFIRVLAVQPSFVALNHFGRLPLSLASVIPFQPRLFSFLLFWVSPFHISLMILRYADLDAGELVR